ncbi:MAG: thioredoxin domain-containing protein [Candidatus Acidiferrales bacterium]
MRTQNVVRAAGLFLALACWLTGLPAQAQKPNEPVAEFEGGAITEEELERALGASLAKLEKQLYDLKRGKLDALIDERLLAREAERRDLSVPELLEAEVTAKAPTPTEEEVDIFYQANKERFKGEEAEVRQQLGEMLHRQRQQALRRAFLASLREQAGVVVLLEPPPVFRAEVSTEGAPALGPADAPVTIVKFEDFQCPYCRRAHATLRELRQRYGDKLRIVHRDLPIESLHPGVTLAHRAARCAGEQGKFWEYHDALYAAPPRGMLEEVRNLAGELALDAPAFQSCLDSGKYDAAIRQDVNQGTSLGISGTPAFFINGRLLSGAQPIGRFIEIIDEELAPPRPASAATRESR